MKLDGFVIDIRRGKTLVEIQTAAFGAMGRKLDHLLTDYRIQLVYPVATHTYLNRPGSKPRRSPKKGTLYSVLDELVSIPTLLDHPNLTLDVLLVIVDKYQEPDPKARRGRGGYRTVDKALREVTGRHRFGDAQDLMELLPTGLPDQFTTADIAQHGKMTRHSAQKLAYCLRSLERIKLTERTRAGFVYSLT